MCKCRVIGMFNKPAHDVVFNVETTSFQRQDVIDVIDDDVIDVKTTFNNVLCPLGNTNCGLLHYLNVVHRNATVMRKYTSIITFKFSFYFINKQIPNLQYFSRCIFYLHDATRYNQTIFTN